MNIVYAFLNTINSKVYVGSSVEFGIRSDSHIRALKRNSHHSRALQNSFNKYGEDSFAWVILEEVKDKHLLIKREQYWINYYKSFDSEFGYNMSPTAGSPLGRITSDATKTKISRKLLGRKFSKETIRKMSLARKGIKRSLEDCQAISKGQLGRVFSLKTKKKISKAITIVWKHRKAI